VAEIDLSTAEPEQLTKAYGSWVRKGPDTPDRPWRLSRIVKLPARIEVVSHARLSLLSYDAPAEDVLAKSSDDHHAPHPDFNPYDLARHFDVEIVGDPFERNGKLHYRLSECIFKGQGEQHSGTREVICIIVGDSVGVRCLNPEHEHYTLGDWLRAYYDLGYAKYTGPIYDDDCDDEDLDDFAEDAPAEEEDTKASGEGTNAKLEDAFLDADQLAALFTIQPETGLDFPEEALYGVLGQKARDMELPLGLAYPSVLGCYSVLPDVDEMCDTRVNLYVAILARVGGGKNEAIKRARVITELEADQWMIATPASDRGLMNLVGDRPGEKKRDPRIPGPKKMLLITNEMVGVIKKASIDKSSLSTTLCDLWDENTSKVADRNGSQGCNCRLSWIGGVPVDPDSPEDFTELFGSDTTRGLLSRMILGFSPDPWKYRPWGWLRRDVPIEASADDYTSGLPKPITIVSGVSDEAQRLFLQWKSKSDDSGRLRYNLMKVALLTASANGDEIVTARGMQAAIEFMGWQERLREVFVPGVSITLEGRFAEAALAAFRRRGGENQPVSWGLDVNAEYRCGFAARYQPWANFVQVLNCLVHAHLILKTNEPQPIQVKLKIPPRRAGVGVQTAMPAPQTCG
jgi:hypothetical protein